MEENSDPKIIKPKSNTKKILIDWGHIVFVICCFCSFYLALVFALDFPLKWALITGLCPVGIFLVILIFFFCILKWDFREWRENFQNVSGNENCTKIIKSILLPILLAAVYFYIRGEDGEKTLYTKSPVSCDMIIHPCGSSFLQNNPANVFDAADLISQPSDDEVYFVTNAVFDLPQEKGECSQTGALCSNYDLNPGRRSIIPRWLQKTNLTWIFLHDSSRATAIWNPINCPRSEGGNEFGQCEAGILYDNGIQTSSCNMEDKLCTIKGWCPPVRLSNFSPSPIFNTQDFTIFLDLKPKYSDFHGPSWSNGGVDGYEANYAAIYAKYYKNKRSVQTCLFDKIDDPHCPRFRLEDIVSIADGTNFDEIATYGGQYRVEVDWGSCKFDWGLSIYDCFPNFKFINRATNKGKPKIFPKITSQNATHRTVTYTLGINIHITHTGQGLQIQLFNLVLYAQFIFVSFQMIKGPFLLIIRCLITIYVIASGCGKGAANL